MFSYPWLSRRMLVRAGFKWARIRLFLRLHSIRICSPALNVKQTDGERKRYAVCLLISDRQTGDLVKRKGVVPFLVEARKVGG